MECENINERYLSDNAVLVTLMSGRKYDVISENGDCLREGIVRNLVLRKSQLSKRNIVTELNMGKTHIQIMVSDVV
jgi:hypothetical protein